MTECDWWQAECARLWVELEATERARYAAEDERDDVLEIVAPDAVAVARQRDDRDAARLAALATLRVALADNDLILEERERQLTAALTAVAAERARCAAVCREVAQLYGPPDVGSVVARGGARRVDRPRRAALLRRVPARARGACGRGGALLRRRDRGARGLRLAPRQRRA